jgi:hypothetical protein
MHVAATYDGSTVRLYVNGVLEGSKVAAFTINSNTLALGVGAEASGARGMRGRIDDVLVANRALGQVEVTALLAGASPIAQAAASLAVAAQPQFAVHDPESGSPVNVVTRSAASIDGTVRPAVTVLLDTAVESSGRQLIVDQAIHAVEEEMLSTARLSDAKLLDVLARAVLQR